MTSSKSPDSGSEYLAIKLPLKHVLKDYDINLPTLFKVVTTCNKVVTHTLMFMKLYLLDQYDKKEKLQVIDTNFIDACMKILCVKDTIKGRPPKDTTVQLKDKLYKYYKDNYLPFIQHEELSYDLFGNTFTYLAENIITVYENNIKMHYIEYIERYINVVFKKKEKIEELKKNYNGEKQTQQINELNRELRKIKKDILEVSNKYTSSLEHHEKITTLKKLITPDKDEYKKNSIYYDLKVHPQDYLPCMIAMMKEVETFGLTIYNVFPMRTNIMPHSVKIDTQTLGKLLITKRVLKGDEKKTELVKNITKYQDYIWELFFKTDMKCFKYSENTKYSFHHMIETDGISCSIILKRKNSTHTKKNSKGENNEQYIDEVKNYEKLQEKRIVAYDPNLSDLIYCVDGMTKDANEYRYTQDSVRKECKIKKYRKIIQKMKKDEPSINGKTIIEYETELSKFNRKTLHIRQFKVYIREKSKLNHIVSKFYQKDIFRKLKLNAHMNKKRHEQKMIKKFKEIYGNPEEVIICAGDYEQKQHMKYKEPVKGKGIRTLFRKNGYKLYLVDEFRTSCMCSKCKNEEARCEKFLYRKNPKPNATNNILVHGVLICKKCKTVWNRDVNSATNIYRIAYNAINGLGRPNYLKRVGTGIEKVVGRLQVSRKGAC